MRLLGHYVHPAFFLLSIAEFVSAGIAFLVTGWLLGLLGLPTVVLVDVRGILWAGVFGLAVVIGMLAMGLYHPRQRLKAEGVVARQIVGLMIASVFLALVDLIFGIEIGGIRWVVSSLVCLGLLVLGRLLFDRAVDQEAFRRRILVLGAGESAGNLLQLRRKSDQRGFKIVAFLPSSGDKHTIDDPRVNSEVTSLPDYALQEEISEIVVAMDDRRQSFPIVDLLHCRFAGIEIVNIVDFLERETGRVKVDLVTPDWMIFSAGYTASSVRDFVLRALDLLIIVATAVVTVPLMLGVALAILLDGGRPVFYRQRRVGLRGTEFTLLKFRSMVVNAESEGEARWAEQGDARVTRVGSVIRRYRLDELPQLVNVLRGEMSLVGPRPERPEFVQRLAEDIPYYNERHCVKPGITGWAQMSYPYGSSEEDARRKLAFDLYYVKHRSLIFNIAVLLQTAEVILWSKGAR